MTGDSCKVAVIGSTRRNDNRRVKRIGGLLPFEVMMKHYEGHPVTIHKLERNYRGWFSNHADEVAETVKKLEAM